MSDSSDNEDAGEQIRVSLTLASEVADRSLAVPSAPIAVPATVGRKGLAAVINHLLDRKVAPDDNDENSDGDDDDDENEDRNDDKLPAIPFDFVLKDNNRLLRTGVEREARKYGLSLEKPLEITYFPAQEAPELQSESETLPDWISCLSYMKNNEQAYLCAAAYDGSLSVYKPTQEHHQDANAADESVILNPMATTKSAHSGPIKCLTTMVDSATNQLLIASGAMDHTLVVHSMDAESRKLTKQMKCQHGHTSAIGSLDFFPATKTLVSGDWDGTIALWELQEATPFQENASKKAKTGSKSASRSSTEDAQQVLTPKAVLPKSHASQISGISWGNLHKANNNKLQHSIIVTGSWDHSVKVWDLERQECLISLNGSRVVACLDTSHHSDGIVATGHPDCSIRLWDVRINASASNNTHESHSAVSDKTFRPSHKAWVSAVQWSPRNPYHLASTSHDGTVKVWDIRSPIPLHTVRVFDKSEKGLCLAYGQHLEEESIASLFLGGTDCVVKQFTTNG